MNRKLLPAILAIMILLTFAAALPALGNTSVTVMSTKGTELEVQDSFTVQVYVYDVQNLFTGDFCLYYQPEYLQVGATAFQVGDLVANQDSKKVAINQIDSTKGQMRFVFSLLGAENSISGNGLICQIPVVAIKKGITSITIQTEGVNARTKLIDNNDPQKYIPFQANSLSLNIGHVTATVIPSAPTMSPAAGTYEKQVSVTISNATRGASILYTIDDTPASIESGKLYSAPLSLTASTTVRAVAVLDGVLSNETVLRYTVKAKEETGTSNSGTDTTTNNPDTDTTTNNPGTTNVINSGTGGGGGGGSSLPLTSLQPTTTAVAQQAHFSDIVGHWAEKNISQLVAKGIISGYPDGSFKPDAIITRAEFAVLLVRSLARPPGDESQLSFADNNDIPVWAKKAIASAVKSSIISGYNDGEFKAARPVTRAEMACMIARAKTLDTKVTNNLTFSDAGDVPEWAKPSIAAAVAKGIIAGRPDHTFAPQDNATRAEAVTMLINMLKTS